MCPRIKNKPQLIENRKALRKNLTPAEATLWNIIKNKQLDGRKFRRQFSVGNYILDFYCPEEKLAVELDGAHHFTEEGIIKDQIRDKYLQDLGIKVVRVENENIFNFQNQVIEYIKSHYNNTVID